MTVFRSRKLRHPWLTDNHRSPCAAYLILGGRGEAVLRDLFLDGDTFHSSGRAEKEPFVGDWQRGFGVRVGQVEVEYVALTRSHEYFGGPGNHPYSRIMVDFLAPSAR